MVVPWHQIPFVLRFDPTRGSQIHRLVHRRSPHCSRDWGVEGTSLPIIFSYSLVAEANDSSTADIDNDDMPQRGDITLSCTDTSNVG